MVWDILFDDTFAAEFEGYDADVQDKLMATLDLLVEHGPLLERPYADTLKGSRIKNLKELRFSVGDGEWRVAFVFDPKRQGILLVAGDKAGANQKRFYEKLITKAEVRYDAHLLELKEAEAAAAKAAKTKKGK